MQLKLILGAGKEQRVPGAVHLDIHQFDGVDVVHDLNAYPWPFKDNSFIHISAIHLVEHLQDLVKFMNECHRILKPGCSVYIETPEAGGDLDLEFCDPTHIRCFRLYTFHNYFSPEGIEKFGYTDKPWCMLKHVSENSIITIHASTIK